MAIDINELRKVIADCYWPTSPVTINELLDRLEAAERDVALKERVIDALGSELNAVAKERDALRAKIKQMEKQEPVAWMHETRRDSDVVTDAVKHVWGKVAVGSMAAYSIPLYTLPGAQPALSEQDESVRKAWARFSNELHRSPDAPYPGMSEAFEKHFSQSFTDREWRAESGVWAAAWKAAKNHGAQPAPSFADAYQGAMEEVAIWKRRALEAEGLNRKFIAEINGPMHMGEPAQPAPRMNMQTADQITQAFKAELQALLDKYGAELSARDTWEGYPECGEDVRMHVDVPAIYDADHNCLREYTEIDLGSWVSSTQAMPKEIKP